jgi:hypothetical protein
MAMFRWIPTALFGSLFLCWAISRAAPPEAPISPDLLAARSDAARDAYQEALKLYQEGRSRDVDRIYRWSLRWLEAEREMRSAKADQVAAARAHDKRMRQLEDLIKTRFRVGAAASVELPEVAYYRAEADILLARAQGK